MTAASAEPASGELLASFGPNIFPKLAQQPAWQCQGLLAGPAEAAGWFSVRENPLLSAKATAGTQMRLV